ncbi:MAG: DNA translocase FtsK, partial [Acinetobacter sp.]|nr:DNA translocase FtsK [Acinetobacter sp.]
FYKNVSPNESDYDLTTQPATKAAAVKVADNVETNANASDEKEASVQPESTQPQSTTTRHDAVAERLFADVLAKEQSRPEPVADTPVANTQNFEHTLEQAHKLERDSQRLVATGEVWRALQRDDASHKQEIDALLRAADDSTETEQVPTHEQFQQTISQVNQNQPSSKQDLHGLDWNDDEIFDELLAAVPNSKTATDVHTPFVQDHHVEAEPTSQSVNIANETSSNISNLNQSPKNLANEQVFEDFDDLLIDEDIAPTEPVRASSYAQSSAFVKAPIQTTIQADKLSKEEFIEAWQETAGKPQENADFDEDDFDFDAPLTDASGRPMSRAMQVAKKRLDLPTLPGLDLLDKVDPNKKVNFTEEQLSRLSELLEIKLQEFNVKAQVVEAQPGPVVTRFELDLAPGVKASKVTNISRDLARSMSMASVRVVEVIPGKPYIGIEVPNSAREMVRLIELLETPTYRDPSALISMAMGKDISGNPVLTDLAKAPHMLVAGTTGSGKSVAVNSMILSMLLKYTPDQLRLILIDPKQLELANYNDIPHLLTPVVTDMKDAVSALNWCVNEMERRYKLMSFLKIRKLSDYNRKVEEAIANGEDLIDPTW